MERFSIATAIATLAFSADQSYQLAAPVPGSTFQMDRWLHLRCYESDATFGFVDHKGKVLVDAKFDGAREYSGGWGWSLHVFLPRPLRLYQFPFGLVFRYREPYMMFMR